MSVLDSKTKKQLKFYMKFANALDVAKTYVSKNKENMNPTNMAHIYKHLLKIEHTGPLGNNANRLENCELLINQHSFHLALGNKSKLPYLYQTEYYFVNNKYNKKGYYFTEFENNPSSLIPTFLLHNTNMYKKRKYLSNGLIILGLLILIIPRLISFFNPISESISVLITLILFYVAHLVYKHSFKFEQWSYYLISGDKTKVTPYSFLQYLNKDYDKINNIIKNLSYPEKVAEQQQNISKGKASWDNIKKTLNQTIKDKSKDKNKDSDLD